MQLFSPCQAVISTGSFAHHRFITCPLIMWCRFGVISLLACHISSPILERTSAFRCFDFYLTLCLTIHAISLSSLCSSVSARNFVISKNSTIFLETDVSDTRHTSQSEQTLYIHTMMYAKVYVPRRRTMDEGKLVMRRGARFNIIHQTSKANCWGFQEEGEEQGQAGRSREWGDRRGQAEVGGKTTQRHI